MSQNFVDEIVEFFKDLILGDFEDDQGKAAMIVGGAISLIPVVDQVMDVRDVSGMIYRVGRKGVSRATRDDWVDMALAAFGCIPEVGSLFKTIIKPLRKYRKEVGAAAAGGNVMIEAMLGKSKGAAIKFLKTFQWAQNTQLAISTAMSALDNCVQLLGYLSTSHWWLPSDLQASGARHEAASRGGARPAQGRHCARRQGAAGLDRGHAGRRRVMGGKKNRRRSRHRRQYGSQAQPQARQHASAQRQRPVQIARDKLR